MKPQIGKHGVVEICAYPYGEFHDRKPEDFDYPMSDTFRGYVEERYGFGGVKGYWNRPRALSDSTDMRDTTLRSEVAPPKPLERITQESITRSIENRRDLQEHFKLHHNLDKKPSSYSYIYNNIVLDESETAENVAEKDPNV